MPIIIERPEAAISDQELREALQQTLSGRNLKKVLLLPPDLTRLHSGAGRITQLCYQLLSPDCQVDIMPALGTHDAMTEAECRLFFGPDIPWSSFIAHRWKTDVVRIGEVPADFIRTVSEGRIDEALQIEINRRLLDPQYDLILSIGQVVPHEVVGMANYSKNILVGCGGRTAINQSHFLGAVYGLERLMGRDHSPVRQVFDYAEEHFLSRLPLEYILTVTTLQEQTVNLEGLYIGRDRSLFEQAVKLSQARNFIHLDREPKKMVVYLDEREFRSTWLGNKAVYRTRMAIADGGELLILAPGVKKFGEDPEIDALLRRYGYVGRDQILDLYQAHEDLRSNPSAAAHLIHGSSDGRFTITYAVRHLSREAVEKAGYQYASLDDMLKRYDPDHLKPGYSQLPDGEEIYFISNPAVGLWASRQRLAH